MKLRIMLADDHALFREALGLFLQAQPDMEVVAEAADGQGVLLRVGECSVDVVCMDIGMRGLSGIETTRELLRRQPGVRVVALSAHIDLARVAAMVAAGALGYVVKGSGGTELLAAIRAASCGQNYFDSALCIQDVAELAAQAGPEAEE